MNRIEEQPCDGCRRNIEREDGVLNHATDTEVCGSSDGPGFFLCGTEACNALWENLDVEARRALFTKNRKLNDEARSQAKVDAEIEAMRVPIIVTMSADKLQNALVSAFEGGRSYSSHWFKGVEITKEPTRTCVYNSDVPFFGGALRVELYRVGKVPMHREVTLETLQDSVRILAEKYPHHAMDLLGDSGDVITGLVLVQCAVFGDIVFE